MKWPTRAVGWFWLVYGLYIGVCALAGLSPLLRMGVSFRTEVGWLDPHLRFGFDLAAAAVVAGAIALLGRVSWGWWVLMANAAVSLVAVLVLLFAARPGEIVMDGPKSLCGLLLIMGISPIAFTLAMLIADPPWKWRLNGLHRKPVTNE